MLLTNVKQCSYVTQLSFAPCNIIANRHLVRVSITFHICITVTHKGMSTLIQPSYLSHSTFPDMVAWQNLSNLVTQTVMSPFMQHIVLSSDMISDEKYRRDWVCSDRISKLSGNSCLHCAITFLIITVARLLSYVINTDACSQCSYAIARVFFFPQTVTLGEAMTPMALPLDTSLQSVFFFFIFILFPYNFCISVNSHYYFETAQNFAGIL